MESLSHRFPISRQVDVESARRAARDLATRLGLGPEAAEECALAVSELATNLARYADQGEIVLTPAEGPRGTGLQVASLDRGPGIDDLEQAVRDGFSTGGGLGRGLSSLGRLMDEVQIASDPAGTRIVARKWPR